MCNKLENFKSLKRCMKLIDKSTDSSVDVDVTYLREFRNPFPTVLCTDNDLCHFKSL